MATPLSTAVAMPFSISPDPFMLYQTASIKTALHKVKYVIERKQGLTTILGDVGMGKSSLLRYINMQYRDRGMSSRPTSPAPTSLPISHFSKESRVISVCRPSEAWWHRSRSYEHF